jgi:hypothetical protein
MGQRAALLLKVAAVAQAAPKIDANPACRH